MKYGETMKFSIITVCKDCADVLERTINSVLSQKDVEIDYIIIDGNSSDGTRDIIEKYAVQLGYWISEADNGVFDAMNKGIKNASG
ncbi:MAG: glycosyltransferase, partial [Lachnospiraceae bacterium]|nr:glycosyltransferase [Lachnospiraceae bacterium]